MGQVEADQKFTQVEQSNAVTTAPTSTSRHDSSASGKTLEIAPNYSEIHVKDMPKFST